MERVLAMLIDLGPTQTVTFTLEGDQPEQTIKMQLSRTQKGEHFLNRRNRGVSVAYEGHVDAGEDFLRFAKLGPTAATFRTRSRRYELDLSAIDKKDVTFLRRALKRMNFDDRFEIEIEVPEGTQ